MHLINKKKYEKDNGKGKVLDESINDFIASDSNMMQIKENSSPGDVAGNEHDAGVKVARPPQYTWS